MRSVSVGRRPAITSSSSSSLRLGRERARHFEPLAVGQRQRRRRSWSRLSNRSSRAQHLVRACRAPRATSARAQQRADHDVLHHRQRRRTAARAGRCAPMPRAADLVGRAARRCARRRSAIVAARPARSTPAIMLNSVVLPAPFGPISAKISPSRHVEADVCRPRAGRGSAWTRRRPRAARSCARRSSAEPARAATARRRRAATSPRAAGRCRRTPA